MNTLSGRLVWQLVSWALSRSAVMLWWVFTPYGWGGASDLYRYAYFAIEGAASDFFPWEYPSLARLGLGTSMGLDLAGYAATYLLAMLALDFGFTLWLLRPSQQERAPMGAWLWILAVPLLGVVPYTRYDMVVGVAVAVAIALSGRKPPAAAALLSLAIALKLWPLVLLPLFLFRARPGQRWRVLWAGLAPWILIEAAGGLLWGSRSATAPWTWQRDRGLQIESVAAGPLRLLHMGSDPIEFRFNAYETTSPTLLLALLTLVGLVLIGLVVVASRRKLMSPNIPDNHANKILATASILIIGLLIVSGKVLSPQYLLWLVAPLAVAHITGSFRDRWLFWITTASCALTTIVFPVMYSELISGELLPWTALQLRNLLLLIVVGLLAMKWWDSLTELDEHDPKSDSTLEVTT